MMKLHVNIFCLQNPLDSLDIIWDINQSELYLVTKYMSFVEKYMINSFPTSTYFHVFYAL